MHVKLNKITPQMVAEIKAGFEEHMVLEPLWQHAVWGYYPIPVMPSASRYKHS